MAVVNSAAKKLVDSVVQKPTPRFHEFDDTTPFDDILEAAKRYPDMVVLRVSMNKFFTCTREELAELRKTICCGN